MALIILFSFEMLNQFIQFWAMVEINALSQHHWFARLTAVMLCEVFFA